MVCERAFPASRLAVDEFLAGRRDRALQRLADTKRLHEWFASASANPVFGAARMDPNFRKLAADPP